MRPSKRSYILESTLRVIEKQGISSLTLEGVADSAGITRAGLMYHFADRETLMSALYSQVAQSWDKVLTSLAGKPAEECSDYERLQAHIQSSVHRASHTTVLLLDYAVTNPEIARPLLDVLARWLVSTDSDDPRKSFVWTTALLAAHGMWVMADVYGKQAYSSDNGFAYIQQLSAWVRSIESAETP
jgi:AcrR family transcriptional regulator